MEQKIKCVVWDLDNTIWDGTLLESNEVKLKDNIVDIIKELDRRGILQSIASKNDEETAIKKLKEFQIDEYFIYEKINWNAKSHSVDKIAKDINIKLDAVAFVDDQEFERDEVKKYCDEVLCIDAKDIPKLLDMPEMNPRFITDDSKLRRMMYKMDIKRNELKENYVGTEEEFLAELGMELNIFEAGEGDLERAEELTVRTHQLNSTGHTYSFSELDEFRKSPNYKLFMASLDDRYGTYGKIGLVLVECSEEVWHVRLLLMSCRVVSRGVGTILLSFLIQEAKKNNKKLRADFVSTDRNRMMYITYKFAGFEEIESDGTNIVFENKAMNYQEFPDYVKVKIGNEC